MTASSETEERLRAPALLVIDMLAEVAGPAEFSDQADPSAAREEFVDLVQHTVAPNIQLLVDQFRLRGHPVVWVTAIDAGTEHEWSGLAARSSDYVVPRSTASAFWSAHLDAVLRNRDVTSVVVVGLFTNEGVLVHAVDASHRGYQAAMVSDASAARCTREHDAALLAVHLQHSVASTNAVLARIATLDTRRSVNHG